MEEIELYTRYRHFKGNVYFVKSIVTDARDGQKLVIYQDADYEDMPNKWARPVSEWFDHIERDGYSGPRFVKDV